MRSLDHFSNGFIQAVARSKQKAKQPVQAKQYVHAQQVQKVNGNVVTAITKAATRMTDEEYKHFIIAKAIEHIVKQRGVM